MHRPKMCSVVLRALNLLRYPAPAISRTSIPFGLHLLGMVNFVPLCILHSLFLLRLLVSQWRLVCFADRALDHIVFQFWLFCDEIWQLLSQFAVTINLIRLLCHHDWLVWVTLQLVVHRRHLFLFFYSCRDQSAVIADRNGT